MDNLQSFIYLFFSIIRNLINFFIINRHNCEVNSFYKIK